MRFIRWALSVIAMLLFGILNLTVAPILPTFREERSGLVGNASAIAVEPRLPRWLSWFDCEDNSLYGDDGWKTEHCPEYKTYFGMVRWLWRNGGHNFNYQVLGCQTGNILKVSSFLWKNDDGFWKYRRFIPVGRRCLEVFLGWNLSGEPSELNKVVCQFRIRTATN